MAPSTSTVNLSASAWRWGAGTAQVPPHGQPGGKSRLTQKMPPVAQKECEVRGGPGVPEHEGCFVKVPGFLGSLKIIIIKISQGPPSRPRGGECGASPSPRAAHADLSLQGLSSQGAHRLAGAGRGQSQHRPRKWIIKEDDCWLREATDLSAVSITRAQHLGQGPEHTGCWIDACRPTKPTNGLALAR